MDDFVNTIKKIAYYIELGQAIHDISNSYPSSPDDAVVVYREWCVGFINECAPDNEQLREYAEYTASAERFHQWMSEKRKAR